MVNDEIRIRNLRLLVTKFGTIAAVANKCDTAPSYLSQILNKVESSTGKARGVGDNLARKLEIGVGVELGWMDINHESTDANQTNDQEKTNTITINQYQDIRGAMGNGLVLRGESGQITGWKVTPDWIAKNVPSNTGNKNLAIVTGFGDSMRGMFNSGDPLLVDAGVKSLDYDGVYFFRIGDEGFIKTLQRIPGEGIRVISENKKYESWTITKDMDFEVFGRVLKVWKSEEF